MPIILIPSKNIYDVSNDKLPNNTITAVEHSYNNITQSFGNILPKEYSFRFFEKSTTDVEDIRVLYDKPQLNEGFSFKQVPSGSNLILTATLSFPIDKATRFSFGQNSNGESILTSHKIKSTRRLSTDLGETFTEYTEDRDPIFVRFASGGEFGEIVLSYSLHAVANGNYVLSDTISLVGNYLSTKESSQTIGAGDVGLRIPSNELVQSGNSGLDKYADDIILEYAHGKEIATILCSVNEYYDENGDIVISTKTSDKMIFEIYDKVVPMIKTSSGNDEAMSYNSDGSAKVFDVIGTKMIYDGAVWQELTLIESSESVEIPTAEKLATPQISISQDLLTIFDRSGKAEQFEILVDGSVYRVISADQKTFDLSSLNLDYGSYKITVIAIANDYINSSQSNAVSYTIVDPNIQTLPTPLLTLEGDTLYIYGGISNAEKFDVWVNGSVRTTITSTTFNLSTLNLGVGTFTIFVVARASGYNDSAQSDSVTYIVEKKTLLLAGKYVFNETPDLSKTIIQPLNTRITVGSSTYTITNISVGSNEIAYTTVEGNKIVIYSGSAWASENLRNIEFLENAEVTTSFYEWFFQNVSKQKITFSIGEKSYTADAGMSWYQWCNSAYNVDKWLVKANTATEQVYRYTSSTTVEAVYDENVKVSAIDKIVQGTVYVTREEFSQESSSAEILEYVDDNFVKKDELKETIENLDLDGYVQDAELVEALKSYDNSTKVGEKISTALIEYDKTTVVNQKLESLKSTIEKWVEEQDYTTDREVTEKIRLALEVNLDPYATDEEMQSAIAEAIKSLNISTYVTNDTFTKTLSGYTNTTDMRSEISTAVGELSVSVSQTTESLQKQIDGSISTWYYEGVPTTSNAPAVNWETDEEKQKHDGDIYYDQITGYAYRWQRSTTGYYWQKISDTDINKALEEAEKAKNMQIGGRNLAWYTGTADSIITHGGVVINSGNTPLSHRWNITKNTTYDGTVINPTIFTAGETYTISYFIRKTAGTLSNIGGHISGFTQKRLSIDGKETSSLYANGVSISNDTAIHYIVLTVKYNGGTENNAFYIQPNRGYTTTVTYDLWNIKVEKGEKATDFTPAWEEYYTTVETQAQIKAYADRIVLGVKEEINTTLSTDYYNKTQTESQIQVATNNITQSVSQTYSTKDEVKTVEGKIVLGLATDSNGKRYSYLDSKADYIKFTGNNLEISSTQFTLDRSGNATFKGNLSGASGSFSGSVTATYITANDGGQIAGWTIDSNSFSYGTLGAANSMWLCRDGTQSTYGSVGGSANTNGWCIAVGTKDSGFGVHKSGVLYATNVKISGYIEATGGNIGGVQIGNLATKNEVSNAQSAATSNAVSQVEQKGYATTTQVSTAKSEAISAAASDATKKANNAQTNAISTASTDATQKANQAKSDAISSASADATNKANAARTNAVNDVKALGYQTLSDIKLLGYQTKSDVEALGYQTAGSVTQIIGNTVNTGFVNALGITAAVANIANSITVGDVFSANSTNGTVSMAGWTVSSSSLSAVVRNYYNNANYTVKIAAPKTYSDNVIEIKGGTYTGSDELTQFRVTADGAVFARNISLGSGAVGQANSVFLGTSGRSSISNTFFPDKNGNAQTDWVLTLGDTFGVTQKGAMYAQKGKIGGWNIGAQAIYSDIIDSADYYFQSMLSPEFLTITTYSNAQGDNSRSAVVSWMTVQRVAEWFSKNYSKLQSQGYEMT